MLKEFTAFLTKYGVIGLAIAVVIGGKANDLVKSVVDNLIMPFVGLFIPDGDWRNLVIEIVNTKFGIGNVLGAMIDFIIVAWFVFIFAKKVLREQQVEKR